MKNNIKNRKTIIGCWELVPMRHPTNSKLDQLAIISPFEFDDDLGQSVVLSVPGQQEISPGVNSPQWDLLAKVVKAHNAEIPGHAIFSFGTNPLDAIRALGGKMGWGVIRMGDPLVGGSKEYDWGFRFRANGTSMQAAGVNVPGGTMLTWWK